MTLFRSLWCVLNLKMNNLSFKRWKLFLNGEFLCFTLLSNFVKKIPLQTLRRRASLGKTDLIRRTTYQFCIFDSFDTYSVYRYVDRAHTFRGNLKLGLQVAHYWYNITDSTIKHIHIHCINPRLRGKNNFTYLILNL